MSNDEDQTLTFVRQKQVSAMTGLSRSSLYDLIRNDAFPKPVSLSEHRSGWVKSEVEGWMLARVKQRDTDPKPSKNPKRPKAPVPARRIRRVTRNSVH